MPLRTGPMGPCELRYNGVLGSSLVESPRLEPPAKHHERHTYHRGRDERRKHRGHQHKSHPTLPRPTL
jgi:hypothetical protein